MFQIRQPCRVRMVAALSRRATCHLAIAKKHLRGLAAARGLKAGTLIHAVRLALTGRLVSPGLFEMATLIGHDRSLRNLDRLITHLTRDR